MTVGLAACGGYAGNSPEQARAKAEAVMPDDGNWTLTLSLIDKDGKTVDTESTSAQYGIASVDGSKF
jgi:hypothetical protein